MKDGYSLWISVERSLKIVLSPGKDTEGWVEASLSAALGTFPDIS
jgi:hypothetical protein